MRKKVLFAVMLLIMVIPIVFSMEVATTQLTINTKPNHDVSVKVTNSETGEGVYPLRKFSSGDNGKVEVSIPSIGAKELNVEVYLAKDFVEITTETFGPFPVKTPATVEIGLAPEEPEVAEEKTETGANKSVTGQVVSENEGRKSIVSKKILLIAALVMIIGFAGFFGVKFLVSRGAIPHHIIVRKQSEILKEKTDEKIKSKELEEAERKLQAAQIEINKLKNKEKIEQVEKRIESEKELLKKLRSGEE